MWDDGTTPMPGRPGYHQGARCTPATHNGVGFFRLSVKVGAGGCDEVDNVLAGIACTNH